VSKNSVVLNCKTRIAKPGLLIWKL